MESLLEVVQIIISVVLIFLVLLHSGKDAGLSGAFGVGTGGRPFGGGSLVRSLGREKLPDFASSIGCESWSQLLLTFILTHPAVTCVIPGTGNPAHMEDDVKAGASIHPDARERILKWWSSR